MKKYYLPMSVSLVVSFLFVFVYAYGASTISTNISTGGTLTVSGNSSLGTITSGTWNGTAIGDAYLTKTGDWTGTFDGYNGPAIAMGTTSVASITTLANLVTV
ncbi:hypothetical protein KKB69_02720, partial [Patescibacteria group bacterium]|nr:hypothetical protein [Patescibacteria group bacterium]